MTIIITIGAVVLLAAAILVGLVLYGMVKCAEAQEQLRDDR